MASNNNIWDEEADDDDFTTYENHCFSLRHKFLMVLKNASDNPRILIATTACLLALLGASIVTCVKFNNEFRFDQSNFAQDMALSSAQKLHEELEQATLVPLHTLASFAKELPQFQKLPNLIGKGGAPGSAPYINSSLIDNSTGIVTHRNVSGICDNQTLVADFYRIAKNIKDGYGHHNGLINLQLAPEGVVCLLYPMNNTQDFQYPLFLDNTAAIGLDNLATQERRSLSEATLQTSHVITAGPLQLSQCKGCPSEVKTAIISRLNIPMPSNQGYTIDVGEHSYSSWGFATVIINWQYLLNKFDIQSQLEPYGIEFIISKTDLIFNTATNKYDQRVRLRMLRFPFLSLLVLNSTS